jgi:hypothetical protein
MRVIASLLALTLLASTANAESVVRYGISLADIPLTPGQPDRGPVPINAPVLPCTSRWWPGR